jgi:hypothetical protein
MGVSAYPDLPAEPLHTHPVMAYVCNTVIPEQLRQAPLESVVCFLTREKISTLWADIDPKLLKGSPGYVSMMHNIEQDALFYFAAAMRADAFIYVFARQSPSEELVFAIWDRLDGLGAFVNRNGHMLTQLPSVAVRGVLPLSIASGDRDEDTVH